jgi:hypothetical protein
MGKQRLSYNLKNTSEVLKLLDQLDKKDEQCEAENMAKVIRNLNDQVTPHSFAHCFDFQMRGPIDLGIQLGSNEKVITKILKILKEASNHE